MKNKNLKMAQFLLVFLQRLAFIFISKSINYDVPQGLFTSNMPLNSILTISTYADDIVITSKNNNILKIAYLLPIYLIENEL